MDKFKLWRSVTLKNFTIPFTLLQCVIKRAAISQICLIFQYMYMYVTGLYTGLSCQMVQVPMVTLVVIATSSERCEPFAIELWYFQYLCYCFLLLQLFAAILVYGGIVTQEWVLPTIPMMGGIIQVVSHKLTLATTLMTAWMAATKLIVMIVCWLLSCNQVACSPDLLQFGLCFNFASLLICPQ